MAKDENLLIAAIEQHEGQSELYGSLSEDRIQAIERYEGRPLGNEVEGRSQVVSRDTFDTVEWIKPDLAEIFCGGDQVVAFSPKGPEDVQPAEQETDFINHVITQRNNWFEVWYGWSHDALVQKVGYVKAWFDDSEDTTQETYENLLPEEYDVLKMDPSVRVVEQTEELDQFGMVRHTCTVERVTPANVVRLENVAPEHIRVSQFAKSLSLQHPSCDFVEHVEEKTISQLRQEGFDVDDDINDGGSPGDYEDAHRDEYQPFQDTDSTTTDPSMRRVKVREVWIRYDYDGDGKAELRHCVVVGRTFLLNEETDLIPIVALCPNPQPHRHYGYSLVDAILDLEKIKTALLRGGLDAQYLANNGRYAINADSVNLDDMLDSRPGGIVRVSGEPGSAIFPLTHPNRGDVAIPMMEYMDSVMSKRTGINEQTQGLDSSSINKNTPYATTAALMTAAQKRLRFIARIFAEMGVKDLFQIVHALTLKHSRQQEVVELRGQWIPVDPRQWVKRKDMQVSVGLGAGDKAQQIAFLQQVIQMQGGMMPMGLATPQNVYNALAKFSRAAGYKDAKEFWTNPAEQPPQPPAPPPEVMVEQMRGQVTMQVKQMEGQIAVQQKQAELELQSQNDQRDAERERLKMQMQAELEAIKQQHEQQRYAMEMEFQRWKAELDAAVKIQVAQVGAEASMQNAATQAAEREVAAEVTSGQA